MIQKNIIVILSLMVLMCSTVQADSDPRTTLRESFYAKLKGKTVAWVPITLGNPIGDSWTVVMRENFDKFGINFIVRDPNFNSTAQLQAVTSLINEQPDVLIVQNPNVSLLARELKRAMDKGIYVIQVGMMSNQITDARVGPDSFLLGQLIGKDILAECGGGKGSGKVALVQGEPTAAASLEQLQGVMDVFESDSSIKVVSNQAANWDSNKAYEITATVLQQHPDLCATYGFWGIMQQGAAQAVKAAGLQGKVKVYASGEGNWSDCDMVEQGLFHKIMSYRTDVQGQQITDAVLTLLQTKPKPGTTTLNYMSNSYWVTGKEHRHYCFEKSALKYKNE